ncbi:10038_t:CDS:2, partial [Acaulospora morrowiae]
MSSRSITPLSDVPLSRRVVITNSRGRIISVVSENFLGDGTSSPASSGTEYIPSSEPPEDAQSEVPSEVSTIEASSFSTHVAPRGRKDILYPSRLPIPSQVVFSSRLFLCPSCVGRFAETDRLREIIESGSSGSHCRRCWFDNETFRVIRTMICGVLPNPPENRSASNY